MPECFYSETCQCGGLSDGSTGAVCFDCIEDREELFRREDDAEDMPLSEMAWRFAAAITPDVCTLCTSGKELRVNMYTGTIICAACEPIHNIGWMNAVSAMANATRKELDAETARDLATDH